MNGLSSKLPSLSNRTIPKRVIISYILDYVIVAALIFGFTLLDAVEPYHQHFSLKNYTLQYPYATKERVPVPLAAFICVACPAGIIAVYTLFIDGLFSHKKSDEPRRGRFRGGSYAFKERLWQLNCGILGLLLSVAAAVTITGALKNATGKPRPDLIDRCRPKDGSEDAPVFGLVTSAICTQKNHAILKDGFRSFPSGHSSNPSAAAFAGLFYLSIYLAAKLRVLDNRGEVWKTFIVLVPTLGAALVADSRIMDARHHPFDVLSGSLLGMVVAWCSYRQYFPPISNCENKGRAYPIRMWGRSRARPNDRDSTVAREEGMEPLREQEMGFPDEEAGMTGYSSAAMPANGENSFQKHVAETKRLRQQEYEAGQSGSQTYDGPPSPPQHTAPLTGSTPFSLSRGSRRRTRHDDDYTYASSEDHDDIELKQTYTITDPRNELTPQSMGAPGDTSYHPTQLQYSQPTRAKTMSPPIAPQRKPVERTVESNPKEVIDEDIKGNLTSRRE
ncbi:hypothetical protein FGG08_005710 [Glutinoglossum americanum]|uniref:Phosphatidic acid phosphatase type 2/haloperoxidase domain-containing protein n=1 Tax=Glutinoglossum americanum TaxID=1670608 RepID=A0A9P8L157_9PEZI|nr:hypothetical protein FGG08_005710 [Glutinoglossum americanum]